MFQLSLYQTTQRMASYFEAATLVASPSYPNSIAWSDENLIAVASGNRVFILSPASLVQPRGVVAIPLSEPYPIGVVKREDLLNGCLLSTCLNRDRRPCVRSISWSPIGMASNAGCLLAVCTTEGRVKLYCSPFSSFLCEWTEVMDISDQLYDYLVKRSFGERDIPSPEIIDERATERECADDLSNSVSRKEHKRRRVNKGNETYGEKLSSYCRNGEHANAGSSPSTEMSVQGLRKVFEINSDKLKENNTHQIVSVSNSKVKPVKKIPENCTLPLITAEQYASRSAMLSSLVVAWSPVLRLSSKFYSVTQNGSSTWFSILAVGGKSGTISLWRTHGPQYFSIEHSGVPTSVVLVGLLQAHNSWITTIGWALLGSDSLNPQVLLATGSSDGSVRIWLGYGKELLKSSEDNNAPFSLLKEVITISTVPVSVLSLTVPVQSPHKMLLAVGKGSGSFEVWMCDLSSNRFDKAGSFDAHDQVVTGLAWAFNGGCLYSCSQDNFVRSWILHGSYFSQVPIPTNTPGLRSSTRIPDAFLSCLGVAVSPGNIAVAMVRSFDVDQLNPMYEARSLEAAVELFWIGGQELDILSNTSPEFSIEAFPDFCEKELVYWESNVLWSLKELEHLNKPLVVWDIIAALLAFKQSIPKYVDHLLLKWLSVSYVGSHVDLSKEKVLSHVSRRFSKMSSRQLHLLNIICRCVILSEMKAEQINSKMQNLGGLYGAEDEQFILWMELLLSSERELRERLVGFSFNAFMCLASPSATTFTQPGYWHPAGLAQMERWVALNHNNVQNQLKVLASKVGTHGRRLHSSEFVVEEQCGYCSASVPFDSPEVAFCPGLECINGVGQNPKLSRCAVSMQVCPITTHLWFCKCCHRKTSKLAPESLFTMPKYPLDFKFVAESSVFEESPKPLCPFCGILLQRLQPELILSASPV